MWYAHLSVFSRCSRLMFIFSHFGRGFSAEFTLLSSLYYRMISSSLKTEYRNEFQRNECLPLRFLACHNNNFISMSKFIHMLPTTVPLYGLIGPRGEFFAWAHMWTICFKLPPFAPIPNFKPEQNDYSILVYRLKQRYRVYYNWAETSLFIWICVKWGNKGHETFAL